MYIPPPRSVSRDDHELSKARQEPARAALVVAVIVAESFDEMGFLHGHAHEVHEVHQDESARADDPVGDSRKMATMTRGMAVYVGWRIQR